MISLYSLIGTNLLVGGLGMIASMSNYPGGEAMIALSKYHSNSSSSPPSPRPAQLRLIRLNAATQQIHVDVHSAMTGATLFNHPYSTSSPWYLSPSLPHAWSYNRSETLTSYDSFDWLITGDQQSHETTFETIQGFEEFRGFDWRGFRMLTEESVWIMRRRRRNQ